MNKKDLNLEIKKREKYLAFLERKLMKKYPMAVPVLAYQLICNKKKINLKNIEKLMEKSFSYIHLKNKHKLYTLVKVLKNKDTLNKVIK